MAAKRDQHTARVKQFCTDLEQLEPSEVIRKHITTGVPVFLSTDAYFQLRNLIADEFRLHPSEVVLVGSCRTGFSIVPEKRYREAKRNSDLDVAIVSQERFDNYWDAVFAYAANDTAWKKSEEYTSDLFAACSTVGLIHGACLTYLDLSRQLDGRVTSIR